MAKAVPLSEFRVNSARILEGLSENEGVRVPDQERLLGGCRGGRGGVRAHVRLRHRPWLQGRSG